jgi:RNA polymerase sigma factor (sigma-70 family)
MNHMEIQKEVTAHYHFIRGTICKISAKYGSRLCDSDIDDVVQNTAELLLAGLTRYNYTTPAKLRTWIGYCAVQRTVDYLRRHNGIGINTKKTVSRIDCVEGRNWDEPGRGIILEGQNASAFAVTEARERLARLFTAAKALRGADAEMFQLLATGEFNAHSYAEEHGVTANVAFVRRNRLRTMLKKVA